MRLRLPRGRTGLVLGALLAAMLVPATVSAAGRGQLTPLVQLPNPSSSGTNGGQAPDIYLVQLTGGADTFRQQANGRRSDFSGRAGHHRNLAVQRQLFRHGHSPRHDRS